MFFVDFGYKLYFRSYGGGVEKIFVKCIVKDFIGGDRIMGFKVLFLIVVFVNVLFVKGIL